MSRLKTVFTVLALTLAAANASAGRDQSVPLSGGTLGFYVVENMQESANDTLTVTNLWYQYEGATYRISTDAKTLMIICDAIAKGSKAIGVSVPNINVADVRKTLRFRDGNPFDATLSDKWANDLACK